MTTGGANTHDHGAATGSTTLTAAQSGLPAHTHTFTLDSVSSGGSSNQGVNSQGGGTDTAVASSSTGGDAAASGHTHTIASANNVPVYVQMKIYSKT